MSEEGLSADSGFEFGLEKVGLAIGPRGFTRIRPHFANFNNKFYIFISSFIATTSSFFLNFSKSLDYRIWLMLAEIFLFSAEFVIS
jgi:hypothetical protein